MAVWIERDFSRTDVADVDEAKRLLRQLWPAAVFCEPIDLDGPHVLKRMRQPRELKGPDAVIVQQEE